MTSDGLLLYNDFKISFYSLSSANSTTNGFPKSSSGISNLSPLIFKMPYPFAFSAILRTPKPSIFLNYEYIKCVPSYLFIFSINYTYLGLYY